MIPAIPDFFSKEHREKLEKLFPKNVFSLRRLQTERNKHAICPDNVIRVFMPQKYTDSETGRYEYKETEGFVVVNKTWRIYGTISYMGIYPFFYPELGYSRRTIERAPEMRELEQLCLLTMDVGYYREATKPTE